MKNRIRIIRNAIIAVLFTSLVSCDVLDVETKCYQWQFILENRRRCQGCNSGNVYLLERG